jgi:hypothetical protein
MQGLASTKKAAQTAFICLPLQKKAAQTAISSRVAGGTLLLNALCHCHCHCHCHGNDHLNDHGNDHLNDCLMPL